MSRFTDFHKLCVARNVEWCTDRGSKRVFSENVYSVPAFFSVDIDSDDDENNKKTKYFYLLFVIILQAVHDIIMY
jgi:hypothetical protein